MHGYAQTNLQLYEELRGAGWNGASLELVGSAYELAMVTCGGKVRPNGKPFLSHLAGTASIVASWDAPVDEVVCGLLHAVYTHGSFVDPRAGVTDDKRTVVRAAVGERCEALIAAYTALPWSAEAAADLVDRAALLAPDERAAARVRLANELEDHLDAGMRYARKAKPMDSSVLALAERVVGAEFARELEAAVAHNAAADVPDALVRDAGSSFSPQA